MSNLPQFIPYESKASVIRITDYAERNPRGWLSNPIFAKDERFENLTQLLFLIEDLQDALSFPKKSMEPRSFREGPGASPLPKKETGGGAEEKALATFKVSVLFRQNASWQGRVVWTEQNAESPFRSALELVRLIDSVLFTEFTEEEK